MPSFSSKSCVRIAGDSSLTLDVNHILYKNSPSKIIRTVRGCMPDNVDILAASNLVITLSGTLDRVNISSLDISVSAVASYLVRFLRTNAVQLGLNGVSEVFVDEADDIAKVTLTSARALPLVVRPHATLVSIDILFKWKTADVSSQNDTEMCGPENPFAPRLFLPYEPVLRKMVEKFVSVHLARRYPLVFGLWVQKLDQQAPFSLSIARSFGRILDRPTNGSFVKKSRKLIKNITEQNQRTLETSSQSLSDYLRTASSFPDNDPEDEDEPILKHMTYEDSICMAMEQLFKNGVPRPRFKGSAIGQYLATTGSEDDDIEFDLSQYSTALATDSSDWNDLPISPAVATPSFKKHDSTILKEHGIDEYYLDDEDEWTQDVDGEWVPPNADLFPPCKEDFEAQLSFSDGEEEFSLSQDLPALLPSPQHLSSSSLPNNLCHISDAHTTQKTANSDQDMDYFEESQDDENDEFPFMSHSKAGDLFQLPIEDPDQRSSQEQPSNLSLRRHESTLSDVSYLKPMISEDMDFRFDLNTNTAIPHAYYDQIHGGPRQHPESQRALVLDSRDEIPDELVAGGPMVGSATDLLGIGAADVIGGDECSEEGDFVLEFDM